MMDTLLPFTMAATGIARVFVSTLWAGMYKVTGEDACQVSDHVLAR